MWGKNADDDLYHYFESLAENRYACGKTQRAKWIKGSEVPAGLCSGCNRHYRNRLKLKLIPQSQPATNSVSSTLRDAQQSSARISPGLETGLAKKSETVVLKQDFNKQTPGHLVSREYEEQYLQTVIQTIFQQTEQSQNSGLNLRQDQARLGNKDFTDGTIVAWKLQNREQMLEIFGSMQGSPYFGRIDFVEEASETREQIYVGRSTLTDSSGDFLIYDWRAPISSLYYSFSEGAASFRAPVGTIRGEIVLKRQYEIKEGRLLAIHDSSGGLAEGEEAAPESAADGMLLSLLKRNSASKMRQIVQSIQSEQDAVIRSSGDVVVVQGPAGSGKTIIALHRAAYLLYQMRLAQERLRQRYGSVSAQRMLIFSPNRIFSDYISRVLPDLHEGQIKQVIIDQMLKEELTRQIRKEGKGTGFSVESKEDQYEYVLEAGGNPEHSRRSIRAGFKTSIVMVTAIGLYVQHLEEKIEDAFFDLMMTTSAGEDVLFSREEMSRQFRMRRDDLSLYDRAGNVLKELKTRVTDIAKQAYIQNVTVRRLEREMRRLTEALQPFREIGLMDLYGDLWRRTDILREACEEDQVTFPVEDIASQTEKTLGDRQIAYEDIVPLLLLTGYLRGFPILRDIDHAVVDEAQDYSLIHYEYIKRCLPENCSLTIVGDVNQAINPVLSLRSYDILNGVFPRRIKYLELTRSYRSSLEITEFAGKILLGSRPIENVRRTGNRPRLVRAPSPAEMPKTVLAILEQPELHNYNSVAVLCKTRQESQTLFRLLNAKLEVTLLTGSSEKLGQGIFILPVHMAKGLEFDAVILQDVGKAFFNRDVERNFLYTACTRALHELYICYSGELSPLLATPDSELYEPKDLVLAQADSL